MADLAALQARFGAGLLAVGDDSADLFQGDATLAAKRFGLYRGNLTANWERSLGNAYPVLSQLVGEEFFRALARTYGRATPLDSGDLNTFGDRLGEFLDGFAPVADYPYMPDLARLEWLMHRAHYASDAAPLTVEDFTGLDAEALGRQRIGLHPASGLLRSDWAVDAVWRAHQPGGSPPDTLAGEALCLVHRPRWRVQLMSLTTGDYAGLLRSCEGGDGATLGEMLESAVEADPEFDPASALPRWLTSRVLVRAP